MNKTIIYIEGIYDTLDLFSDKLREAFEIMGYQSFVYDARMQDQSKTELLELLSAASEKAVDEKMDDLSNRFTCITFNNLGYNLDLPGGRNLWEYYHISYINILMDHPFHFERPLRSAPETSVVLCTDRNHVKYIRRYYRNISKTDFLPHAGIELGFRHKPLRERKIDVLYAGALPIYTVAKMIPDLTSIPEVDGQMMAQDVLNELVSHPEKTTETVIEDYLRTERNDLPDERIHQIIVKMRFLDSYATSFFREQAVRVLVESGIKVTAYGTGWDQCDWSGHPYLSYGGKVLAPRILSLMNDSKIVLNTMTWFKAGAHDRVFNGMLAGAAVVTDDSAYLRREFTDGKELTMFSLKEIGMLPERVFELFGHIESTQQMADCGYQAAKTGHTWKSRAQFMAECYL